MITLNFIVLAEYGLVLFILAIILILFSVLNGGFQKMLKENKVVTSKTENFNKSDYLVKKKKI